VLIADEQGIEPGAVCRRRSLDHPARSLARIFHAGVIARERDSNSHSVILVTGSVRLDPTSSCKRRIDCCATPKNPAPPVWASRRHSQIRSVIVQM
jgi:hypothetical protein